MTNPSNVTNGQVLRRFGVPSLLVLCGMAAGILAPEALRPSMAAAQSSSSEPPFNSAEQRKTMIAQLTQINERLGRLESKLDKPLSVKVTEMPAQKDSGK